MSAVRVYERDDWRRFAGSDWLERIMHIDVTDQFHAKQGRSTGRCVFRAAGSELCVYLKRHYQLPWWQGLLARVVKGRSPAWQEQRNLQWAREQGVPVPETVAAGEFVGPGVKLQSFLAVEELTGMLPLHEAIPAAARQLDATTFTRWKRTLIGELARLANELHGRRRFHKDFYLCHFFIAAADTQTLPDWRGRVFLIDLHRLAYHPLTWRLRQIKDIAQLLFSSDLPGITPRDRLYFWKVYFGPERRGWLGRTLAAVIRRKFLRYLRHNEKRYGYQTVTVLARRASVEAQTSLDRGAAVPEGNAHESCPVL